MTNGPGGRILVAAARPQRGRRRRSTLDCRSEEESMTGDPTWDFLDPASKGRLLGVLEREIDEMFELAAEPTRWHAPTACTGWELRDMIGHLLAETEGYLSAFDVARRGVAAAKEPIGVAGMAKASDESARSFRHVPRDELLERARDDTDRLLHVFDSLSDADWSGLIVPERYMGPLPAMAIVEGLLGGYTVHGWDVREGLGARHAIAGDAADLLVPFVYLLWGATADTTSVDSPYAIGVRTTGVNGGDTRFDVSNEGLRFAPGDLDECEAILEFDPATLVLTAYGRVNAGTVRGDRQIASSFRSLFVSI
jgi:uncharacterized protein (TIGR03083 family)